jgi:cytochrome c5
MAIPLLLLARGPQDQPQRKGPTPKNLKVLPPDTDIRATMGAFRTALGQQCTFCHAQAASGPPDFASDENPMKTTARNMILMVKDINAKFPDGKTHVTCYTCHRGAAMPLTAPPPAQ